MRYLERNPVRAGLVERAEDYEWSSASAHCGRRGDDLLAEMPVADWLTDWSAWLRGEDDEAMVERLRSCTRTGRPAGGDAFIERVQSLVGRVLRPQKGGRPRKPRKRG